MDTAYLRKTTLPDLRIERYVSQHPIRIYPAATNASCTVGPCERGEDLAFSAPSRARLG